MPLNNSDGRRQVCKEDSDCRNGESRGQNREDKGAAMGVKEVEEDKMEEDYKEKGQEEKQEDEQQERKMSSKRSRKLTSIVTS